MILAAPKVGNKVQNPGNKLSSSMTKTPISIDKVPTNDKAFAILVF